MTFDPLPDLDNANVGNADTVTNGRSEPGRPFFYVPKGDNTMDRELTKSHVQVRKLVLTAMFACLSFVLCTCVYFPAMAPFQHFVDVLAAVFVGPWYACAAAFLCGIMRMMTGRTIQAVTGAVFGPVIGGLLYRKTKNIWLVWLGEVFGTGICGALASYPLMKKFYGLDVQNPFYYVPFYIPSAIVGGAMGVLVFFTLKKSGLLTAMTDKLEGRK